MRGVLVTPARKPVWVTEEHHAALARLAHIRRITLQEAAAQVIARGLVVQPLDHGGGLLDMLRDFIGRRQ